MGALRAAELESFGMVGIGEVFKAFQAGAMPPFEGLSDDDEVAVIHGPAESGYIAVTDAMINIRHTVKAALTASVIDKQTAAILLEVAKTLHFSKRTYTQIMDHVRSQEDCIDALERLKAWLPTGKVNQKSKDAVALIEYIARLDLEAVPPFAPHFIFETTEIFHDTLLSRPVNLTTDDKQFLHFRAVLDELRLNENVYQTAKRDVMARHTSDCFIASTDTDNNHKPTVDMDKYIRQVADEFRKKYGLLDRETIDAWLETNDLDVTDFDQLIIGEAQRRVSIMTPDTPAITNALIDHLRMNGSYPAFSDRARQKSALLESRKLPDVPLTQLYHWYFEVQNSVPIPADIPVHAYQLGLASTIELVVLLLREYHYLNQRSVDTSIESGDG